jgi:hypothetical protein
VSARVRPHPHLNAMLLCNHTIREHGTGKISLIGGFENISAAPGELIFALENLSLQRPGRYDFRLYGDDRFVADKSFTVVPATSS